MELKKIPPRHLWSLGLLTDSAVCSTQTETDFFARTAGINPAAFSRYCIFDETYGVWRILVEGRVPPLKEP